MSHVYQRQFYFDHCWIDMYLFVYFFVFWGVRWVRAVAFLYIKGCSLFRGPASRTQDPESWVKDPESPREKTGMRKNTMLRHANFAEVVFFQVLLSRRNAIFQTSGL